MIGIHTTRLSALYKRILEEYGPGSEIRIDGQIYGEHDVPHLLRTWCTNRNIGRTINFSLSREGTVLFAFHDDGGDIGIPESERAFVDRLLKDRIVRLHRPATTRKFDRSHAEACLIFAFFVLAAAGWGLFKLGQWLWRVLPV